MQGIKQESFDFLGFTIHLGRSKNGTAIPKLKTKKKTFSAKLKCVKEWIKAVKDKQKLPYIWKSYRSKLKGHIQYYGVSFNCKMVKDYIHEATRIIFKWLNRRSQKKSFTWEQFDKFRQKYPLPKARIIHKLF